MNAYSGRSVYGAKRDCKAVIGSFHSADEKARGIARKQDVDSAPILFLAGLFETSEIWDPIRTRFRDKDQISVPLPGHCPGETSNNVLSDLTTGKWLEALARKLKKIGGPVHVVGHSSGGLLALHLAHRFPMLVKSVVLVGAPVVGHRDIQFDPYAILFKNKWLGKKFLSAFWQPCLATRTRFDRVMRAVLPRNSCSRVPDAMRQTLGHCDPEAIRQFGLWVLNQDATDLIQQVKVPALVVIGRQDRVVSPTHQLRLVRGLPNAHAQIVPGGHLPFIEHPVAFERTLRSWLALRP